MTTPKQSVMSKRSLLRDQEKEQQEADGVAQIDKSCNVGSFPLTKWKANSVHAPQLLEQYMLETPKWFCRDNGVIEVLIMMIQ